MNLKKLSTVEFRDKLSEVVNEAAYGNRATIIERHGKEVAVLMPIASVAHMIRVQAGVVTSISTPPAEEFASEFEKGG